jgi:anthranilate synthase component 1
MNNQNNVYPDKTLFKKLAKEGNLIPVYREVSADLETPVSTFLKLAADEQYAYLLESVEGGERWGRYSFISWSPQRIFRSKAHQFAVHGAAETPQWKPTTDPLAELKAIMGAHRPVEVRGLPRFWGGAVGYVSYDMVRFFEDLPNKPEETVDFPDAFFMLTDRLVVFDHLAHTVKIVMCIDIAATQDVEKAYAQAVREIEKVAARLRKPLAVPKTKPCKRGELTSNIEKADFCHKIEEAQEHICAGDIVQVVLSQRFSRETSVEPLDIYRSLRLLNPSPYMYFIKAGDFNVIGSSPEILVRKEEMLVETRPIAGTRPRGETDEQEKALVEELLADPKERAEHIMLVDLGRNDLARVSQPASVTVPQLMTVEKYSHVMHIVSSVTGTLKPGMDSFEVFRACFPAGTVSGAPKVSAMKIIDDLETTARGPYAGAVGYFSYSGNMDMAITIRTIVLKDKVAYCQAGAGIVADSVPENEYQETRNKAAVLFAAIDRAEKGIS